MNEQKKLLLNFPIKKNLFTVTTEQAALRDVTGSNQAACDKMMPGLENCRQVSLKYAYRHIIKQPPALEEIVLSSIPKPSSIRMFRCGIYCIDLRMGHLSNNEEVIKVFRPNKTHDALL
jgi:hypothetical protein